MNDIKEIQPVTLELIKTMRYEGMNEEANKLLLCWKQNKTENRKQLKKELLRYNRMIKKNIGICIFEYCKNEAEGEHSLCKKHRENMRKYYKDNCKKVRK